MSASDELFPETRVPEKDATQLRHEAVEILQRYERGLPGTRDHTSPAPVKRSPATAEKSLVEGRVLLNKGIAAEALLRADAAIGLAPPGSNLLADSLTLHGRVRLLQSNPQAARAAFTKALDVNPAHVEARLGLSEAYRVLGQPARAVPLYLEAIALLSDPAEKGHMHLLLADTYREAGKPQAARRVLRLHGAGQMSRADRLRALPAFLLPGSSSGWLLLLCLLALAVVLALEVSLAVAALTLLLAALLYITLQWWHTSAR